MTVSHFPELPVADLDTSTRTVTQEVLFQLARIPGAVHRDTLAEADGTSPDYASRVLSRLVNKVTWLASAAAPTSCRGT